jgi:hypothetical protein
MKLKDILARMTGKDDKGEKLRLHGSFTGILRHPDGSVECRRKDNLILDVGFDFIADAIGKASSRPSVMAYTAVGTGTTATAASQTGLATELARKAATYSHTAGTKVFTFTTNFAEGEATGAITEAGICNAASDGIFLDRVTFAVINKGADDTYESHFQFTLS